VKAYQICYDYLIYNKILINYIKRSMPPKRKNEVINVDIPITPAKTDGPEPKTRTRGRQANNSTDKNIEPNKKIKIEEESEE